jgi:hypothetical protein
MGVASRDAASDQRGFPRLESVVRVDGGTARKLATVRRRVDVHGLAVGGGFLWLADNEAGLLLRLPTGA